MLVYISQPAVFIRRAVFSVVGLFDEELRAAGDFEFWIRAFRRGVAFKRIPRILTIVRLHGANLSLSAEWQAEHTSLRERYLPGGLRGALAEVYRNAKRKLLVNQLTLPLRVQAPGDYVRFNRRRYFRYLLTRKPTKEAILEVNLPYFRFSARKALNFGGHAG